MKQVVQSYKTGKLEVVGVSLLALKTEFSWYQM